MKKVLYITTISDTINSFLIPHIKMLIDDGCIVDCACSINKEIDKSLMDNNVKVYDVPFSRNPLALSNIKAYRELVKLQKINKYDIIHVHTPVAAFWGRLLKLMFKKLIIIYTVHGFHFYKGAPIKNWLFFYTTEKIESRWTDVIITINEEDYSLAQRKFQYKNNRIYKINGIGVDLNKYKKEKIDVERYRQKINLCKDDFVVCVIGELNKNKNQIQGVRAVEQLASKYKNIKLILVGEGKLKERLEREIENNNMQDNIKILGYRNDVDKIINCSDVVASFSYREGLPRCLLEAMAIGKTIICTKIRGNKDLIKDGYNGVLVSVNNIQETMSSIFMLYSNRNKLHLYEANQVREIKHYGSNIVKHQMKKVYEDLDNL